MFKTRKINLIKMNTQELDLILRRNKLVSRFLGAGSLEEVLNVIGITLTDAEISMTTYAVGTLYATQLVITPAILRHLKQGRWNAESNEFFIRGQSVDFTKEPIIVMHNNGHRRYIAVGNTRAKYVYDRRGYDAQIPAIDLYHPKVEQYVNHVEGSIGLLKRISQL